MSSHEVVLTVSGEPGVADLIDVLLGETLHVQTVKAHDIQQALSLLQEVRPSVAIVELTQPDGEDWLYQLRATLDVRGIPLVALVHNGDDKERELALRLRADEVVKCPFELEALVEAVRKHLLN
jgi:DNA-binding response OmpR family regulator